MKKLTDFDCLCLQPRGVTKQSTDQINAVFPNARHVLAKQEAAKLEALSQMTGAYVLVVPEFIIPLKSLALATPDPVFLDAGFRIGWMSRNIATSELATTPTPELWQRQEYIRFTKRLHDKTNSGAYKMPLIANMPECQAIWAFNTSSGAAFSAGMLHATTLQSDISDKQELQRRLVIAASFGQDIDFCDWWQLGVMNGILGETNRAKAYAKEKEITAKQGEMGLRLNDLAREIRLNAGLDLITISAKNSRFFKTSKFLMPPRASYSALADQYRQLGQAGKNMADKYVKAANWIWGEA